MLKNSGKISHEIAIALADEEYEKFRVKQDTEFQSDFDNELEKELKQLDKKKK